MAKIGIKSLTALRLSVGLAILASWGLVASFYNPFQTSGDMFDPTSVSYSVNYANMMICSAFAVALGAFFLGITFISGLKSFAIASSREGLYSQRFFRFVGFVALAAGLILIAFSIATPF